MDRSATQLRDDALAIWQAGVDAVASERLVVDSISVSNGELHVAGESIAVDSIDRIVVVGAGKAGAGMASGVESALHSCLDKVSGWVNVPADCVQPLQRIRLHAARPAGLNEPTEEGVEGARHILDLVSSLGPNDLCLCLISGGGSALLPLPVDGITLADKQTLTRHLSAAGANIAELNTVRKQLSQMKGGGLARACTADRLITLVISDVIGDPLDVIASGPTVPDTSTAADALEVLSRYECRQSGVSDAVWQYLEQRAAKPPDAAPACVTVECIIGNNAVAVAAAGLEAERRGYRVCREPAEHLEGDAGEVGRDLARRALLMREGAATYDCLISGGEPTVELAPASIRGRGGRNQQLVAAAMEELHQLETPFSDSMRGIVILSGGTDGEDGPTDAAGAVAGEWIDDISLTELRDALQRNDTYSWLASLDSLIKTGPTNTNVCDLRVIVTSHALLPPSGRVGA